ncbi:MAG: hypothetical protein M3Q30_24620 [Actinomycetota bacterium]|nr:hypothetical protein [Actinomycetota bacterium]
MPLSALQLDVIDELVSPDAIDHASMSGEPVCVPVGAGNTVRPRDLRFRAGLSGGGGRREDPRVARFYRVVRLVLDLLVLRSRRDRSKEALLR